MEKTQVMVYFSLFGDEFPIEEVTKKLGLIPTQTYKKGDIIPNHSTASYRKETSWDLGTGYQESFDVNNQFQQILEKLQNKSSIINELKRTYTLDCKFFIVVIIKEGNAPALYLDNEMIKFALSIEAEFDVDLYANPYQ